MADRQKPVPSPGDYIRAELKRRGWGQDDLARVLSRPASRINELAQGKLSVSPEIALALSAALGGTAEEWLQRESAYRLSLASADAHDIRRRARLYELAPVKDIQRRGWIKATDDVEELERELLHFFDVHSLSDEPEMMVALRKSNPEQSLTPAQRAWCFRTRSLASTQIVAPFDETKVEECAEKLRKLAAFVPEARKVAGVLANYGIRFVIIEPLPGTKIDGVAFWIGDQPVIGMSLRYDRIDAFWFTLCHELSHIRHRDALSVDTDLVGDDAVPSVAKPSIERRADKEAAERLIPADKLKSFIHRVAPLYSKDRIIQFAHRIKIHPGIIVGQLQHQGQIGFHANRELLAKVRDIAISGAIVDGWGHSTSEERHGDTKAAEAQD